MCVRLSLEFSETSRKTMMSSWLKRRVTKIRWYLDSPKNYKTKILGLEDVERREA